MHFRKRVTALHPLMYFVCAFVYTMTLWLLIECLNILLMRMWPLSSMYPVFLLASVLTALGVAWLVGRIWTFDLNRGSLLVGNWQGALLRRIQRIPGGWIAFFCALALYFLLSYRPKFYDLSMMAIFSFGMLCLSLKIPATDRIETDALGDVGKDRSS